ncbi:ureidoglycolate lyase [Acidithiobacillus sp. IBUN Pt1247-S3]|uniref:ureidoglycolate lyase n=1 Tax=Acidithiobacillus sp. IBUN Pt1247-S3 TaxID=3166642 RepID=UPI0034E58F09
MFSILADPVTEKMFAPYGHIIDIAGQDAREINHGCALRIGSITRIDAEDACVNIYRTKASSSTIHVEELERHPRGSQLFMPLFRQTFIVVVAGTEEYPSRECLRAFVFSGGKGVNLFRGVWHHSLISSDGGDFLVVEHCKPQTNIETFEFSETLEVTW